MLSNQSPSLSFITVFPPLCRLESNPFSCGFVSLRHCRQVAPRVVAVAMAASFKWTGKENTETAGGDGVMGGVE